MPQNLRYAPCYSNKSYRDYFEASIFVTCAARLPLTAMCRQHKKCEMSDSTIPANLQ